MVHRASVRISTSICQNQPQRIETPNKPRPHPTFLCIIITIDMNKRCTQSGRKNSHHARAAHSIRTPKTRIHTIASIEATIRQASTPTFDVAIMHYSLAHTCALSAGRNLHHGLWRRRAPRSVVQTPKCFGPNLLNTQNLPAQSATVPTHTHYRQLIVYQR